MTGQLQLSIEHEGETLVITLEPAELAPEGAPYVLSCEFALARHLAEYEAAEGPIDAPWVRLAGFQRPIDALKKVFCAALTAARAAGAPMIVDGSDEKRRRVYEAMLRRAGVAFEAMQYGDIAKRHVLLVY